MLTETTIYWINLFSTFGWVLLIPMLEKVLYIYPQPFLREGLTNDFICTYQNFVFQFLALASQPIILEALLAASLVGYFFPAPTGGSFLQGSLANQPIAVNFIVLVFTGEITFYVVHYFFHVVPALWEFHRVHHSSVVLDSLSTSRFHILERIAFSFPNVVCMIYLGATVEAMAVYFFFRSSCFFTQH